MTLIFVVEITNILRMFVLFLFIFFTSKAIYIFYYVRDSLLTVIIQNSYIYLIYILELKNYGNMCANIDFLHNILQKYTSKIIHLKAKCITDS